MIPTSIRSDRLLLAVSFACFAIAGIAAGNVEALVPTIGATAVAITGVYCVAQYATRVSRRTLADLAIAFWLGFLVIAALHTVGLETVGATAPGNGATIAHSLTAVTWATLLTAVAATTFLGFREYGTTTSAESPEEQVLEGDSDYSTQ